MAGTPACWPRTGCPALLVRLGDDLDGVLALQVQDGLVTGLYYVQNPEKLARLGTRAELTAR